MGSVGGWVEVVGTDPLPDKTGVLTFRNVQTLTELPAPYLNLPCTALT